MHKFKYDAFQQKAIDAIEQNHSVLVSAPTGCGKTAIAEYAIYQGLKKNQRVIFTAPIKAISNQKYREFNELFPGQVGILTGDIAIEPHAPLLIVTTEIYRNQLFESPKQHENTAWAIFDEVHFLDDKERGTVWEEAIMFSNPNTRFLCLSATAPNISELGDWIQSIHQHPITLVTESKRPVELKHYFHCQNIIFNDLATLRQKGFMGMNTFGQQRQVRFKNKGGRRGQYQWGNTMRAKANRIDDLLKHLIQGDKLPVLYFAFGRKRVEELADAHTHFTLLDEEEREENVRIFDSLAQHFKVSEEKSAIQMRKLVERGIAYHHAGLLPSLKEVVERLFTAKKIQLIFTTETFALGINMPARTVVFDELRKFYGFGFDFLTTRDFFQMAGRAGRRGLDTVGYVYSRINPHQISHSRIKMMLTQSPEQISSQFSTSFATLLNLYRKLGPKLLDVYPRSFHYFQNSKKKHKRAVLQIERQISLLTEMNYIEGESITAKGEFALYMYGYELVLSELWESNWLNQLSATELCILLAALVFEPRKNDVPPRIPDHFLHIAKESHNVLRRIHHMEEKHHIFPPTKEPHFHISRALEAWIGGCTFDELSKFTDLDEGAIIRYFRMVIQLLRQLRTDPGIAPELRKNIQQILPLINRDIVDAEKLLRASSDKTLNSIIPSE